MPRLRKNPLPPGIHERRYRSGQRSYWIDFRTPEGVRVQEVGGSAVDDAVRLLRQRRAEVAAGTYQRGAGSGDQTLATYAKRWIEHRRTSGVRTVGGEDQILRDHVLPSLGARRMADLRPRDVGALVAQLGGTLAPKTILNVHGTLSALLARARFEDLISENVAKNLPRGTLPRNVRSRVVGAWTRAEVEALISDDRVPEDRRVGYAIAAFTGARLGEIAGMRWRDLDVQARPLWRWALRLQYGGETLKTERPRDIPIHPELQRLLAAWKIEGWPLFMCRRPTPDDFVVPRNAKLRTARPQHADAAHHSKQSLGSKAAHRHAKKIGLDPTGRDFHSFRRAMITLCRTDGARVDVLERITHNAAGAMIDAYTYFGWPELCAAVSVLRLAVRRGLVLPLRRVAGGDASGDAAGSGVAKASIINALVVEAPGVEPGSGNALRWPLRA